MISGSKNILKSNYSFIYLLLIFLVVCARKAEKTEPPVYREIVHIVRKGENIETILHTLALTDYRNSIINILEKGGFPFKKCLPGDSMIITKKDEEFQKLMYRQDLKNIFYVTRDSMNLCISMKLPYIDTVDCFITGEIKSTLYESMVDIGENSNLVMRYADIFAWEIDFFTDTQEGDSFYLYIKKTLCDSHFVEYTDLVFARYNGKFGDFIGIYYRDPDGYEDYYNLQGQSLRKSLLKSPLRFAYISSYFAKRRFHPILKIWRPHHGLDYVAPIGTPIASIGDGIIKFQGWKGGYGKLIEIQHKNNFRSRYGHLSRYAKGLYVGKRVKAGDLIGYVGSTGLSTGPHLHFELHRNGAPINPLKVKVPRAPSVKKQYMDAFKGHCDSLLYFIEGLSQDMAEEVSINQ